MVGLTNYLVVLPVLPLAAMSGMSFYVFHKIKDSEVYTKRDKDIIFWNAVVGMVLSILSIVGLGAKLFEKKDKGGLTRPSFTLIILTFLSIAALLATGAAFLPIIIERKDSLTMEGTPLKDTQEYKLLFSSSMIGLVGGLLSLIFVGFMYRRENTPENILKKAKEVWSKRSESE